VTSIRKNLQFRTFDSAVKESGILHRRELVLIPTEDQCGKSDFFYLIHHVEQITGQEVSVEDLRSASHHLFDASLD
jgi:hypothetical protein